MKNLTKTIAILIIITAIIAGFSSCSKYEDGPSFSLISKTKRIVGTWKLTETKVNDAILDYNEMLTMLADMDTADMAGVDLSSITINSIKIDLVHGGTGSFIFAYSYMGFPMSTPRDINWEFNDDKTHVRLEIEGTWEEFEILRLSKEELWLRKIETDNGQTTTTIMEFEKN